VPIPVTESHRIGSVDTTARRDSLIRLLRRQGSSSVADLAARLGVSRRTVLRDLAALRTLGFAVAGEGGRGGGVQLDPGSVLVSSQLAADEVVALVLSVAVMRAAAWIPFAAGAERALGKIEGALPPDRVRELRRFMKRVLVGDPVEAQGSLTASAVDPALLPAFERAFAASCVLRFEYVDRQGRRTRRRVEPHGVLVRAPLWYIVAWDLDKDAARLFRMDRVRRPVVQAEVSFLPRPIELVTEVCPDARAAPEGSPRYGGFTSARVAVPKRP
jgi:predicted DNA-binding transcriptional regulator YafY